jgi:hypothetical protein
MAAVFEQEFALKAAIGSHVCSLEASMRVTNSMPLGVPLLLLPVGTIHRVETLKAREVGNTGRFYEGKAAVIDMEQVGLRFQAGFRNRAAMVLCAFSN